MPARLVNLADVVEVYHRTGGVDAAVAVARERSGTQFDPALVDVFCAEAPTLFGDIDVGDDLAGGDRRGAGARDRALRRGARVRAGGDRRLHRPQVARGRSATRAAWPTSRARPRRSTGCRTPTPSSCAGRGWCTTSVASASPTRSGTSAGRSPRRSSSGCACIPYLTERMLASSAALAPLGRDRRPAPRAPRRLGVSARAVRRRAHAGGADPRGGRRLSRDDRAAASPRRAHCRGGRGRAARGRPAGAVRRRRGRRRAARGGPSASSAGASGPAGLTSREVEVLRLLVRGLSNKEIAEQLVISRKTAGSHVEHIYSKIGVSNRARASLFAIKHGLMAGDVGARRRSGECPMRGRPADRTVARMTQHDASTTTLGRLGAWAADHRRRGRRSSGAWSCSPSARSRRSPTGRCRAPAGRRRARSPGRPVARSSRVSPGRGRTRCRWSWPARAPGSATGRCAPRSPAWRRVLRRDRAVSGVLAPQPGVDRLAGPPHRDRRRARGRGAVGDGRGGGAARGPPRPAVQRPASRCASPARPRCGPTSTTPTRPR